MAVTNAGSHEGARRSAQPLAFLEALGWRHRTSPLEEHTRRLIRGVALHRVFDEQVPRMGQLAKIEALQGETFPLVRSYLEKRRNEISVRDLDSATSILVTTVEALTHQFVIHRPGAHASDRDRFIDEVTRLVVGYLQPGRR